MNKKITAKLVIGTFCLAWLLWGSIIIANQFGYLKYGTPLSMVFFLLGGTAPAIVAVTLLLKNKVMPTKQLFKMIFAVKQPILMYLCTIGFAALYFGIFVIGTFGISFALAAIYRLSKSAWLCIFLHSHNNSLYDSFQMKIDRFDSAFVPAIITASVLIAVSLIAVFLKDKFFDKKLCFY